jgi:hypothetical protein
VVMDCLPVRMNRGHRFGCAVTTLSQGEARSVLMSRRFRPLAGWSGRHREPAGLRGATEG